MFSLLQVYDLGSTVGGVVTGLGRTGQAAVGMSGAGAGAGEGGSQPKAVTSAPEETSSQSVEDEDVNEEEAGPGVRRPPKLEIRSQPK